MAKIKMKYWRKAVTGNENSKELRKMETRNLDQFVIDYGSNFDSLEKAAAECGFIDGFRTAKSMIIQFLNQKSLGYNDAYFFKMEDLKALGEPDYKPDEPLKESERIAKWDWSK